MATLAVLLTVRVILISQRVSHGNLCSACLKKPYVSREVRDMSGERNCHGNLSSSFRSLGDFNKPKSTETLAVLVLKKPLANLEKDLSNAVHSQGY